MYTVFWPDDHFVVFNVNSWVEARDLVVKQGTPATVFFCGQPDMSWAPERGWNAHTMYMKMEPLK